ncbi:MAG: hypothetical protein M3R08_10150 [Bacteroidota bacterium]|nr:hypothetical protein [Bacteroidota bacterium]
MLRQISIILLLLTIAPVDLIAQGCAMCKAVAESEQTFGVAQSVGLGLNNGILYLMAVPYLLLFLLFRKRIVGFVKELSGA